MVARVAWPSSFWATRIPACRSIMSANARLSACGVASTPALSATRLTSRRTAWLEHR
jgi:hypothetical protein